MGMKSFTSHVAHYLNARGCFQFGILSTEFSEESLQSGILKLGDVFDELKGQSKKRLFDKPVLLILNSVDRLNEEQLAIVSAQLEDILRTCPEVKLILTSSQAVNAFSWVKLGKPLEHNLSFTPLKYQKTMAPHCQSTQVNGLKLDLPLLTQAEEHDFVFTRLQQLTNTKVDQESFLGLLSEKQIHTKLSECNGKIPLLLKLVPELVSLSSQKLFTSSAAYNANAEFSGHQTSGQSPTRPGRG